MWRLYQTAKATYSRPSALLCVADEWAAYQFDSAVAYFGLIIENASQELIDVGQEDKPRMVPRYKLGELLTPGFVISNEEAGGDELPRAADGLIYDEIG